MSGLVHQRSLSGVSIAGSLGRRPEYQTFKSNTHNNGLITGLNDLRQDGIFCDVTLIADDRQFLAHKNVLASCSPYLRELFEGEDGFKTAHEVVEVRGVTEEGLQHLITFIYTSELHLSMKNVHCVLSAAGHMQIKPVLNFCKMFLILEISVYNCVDIIHIAEKYQLPGVEEKAYNFIAEHLNELVKTEEIQKLTIENMSLLLDSYSLKNVSELELFEASRQWLLKTPDRYRHVRQLMEKIHFPLIPPRDLLRYVNFVEFMRVECNYLLLEASNYHMLPHSQPILQSIRTQVRSTDTRMVIIGGVDPHDRVSNQLFAVNGDMSKSEFLPPMHEGLCSHCACVMNNFLYVIGGQNMFDERGATAVNTVIRYDPRFNIWMRIASMNDKRAGFTSSVVDNRIYALGGVNAAGRMSSMECYSLDDDRWRYVASVQTGLCDHAQAVHGNLIYISGGFKEGRFNNQLLAYSPRHDTWHERTPMHFARGWHAMVTYGDSIFVTGGNAGLTKRVDIHETEIYNAMNDQWTLVAPVPQAHSEGGCEFYDDKIYVVGGYSWAQQKCLNTLQCYDPVKDSWSTPGNIPIELSGVRLTTLTIPYSVSSRSGLISSSHVPLAWPTRQVPSHVSSDQDPRFMIGAGSTLGSNPSSTHPYYPGYMDPFMMADMRDAFSEFSHPNSRMIAPPPLSAGRASDRGIPPNMPRADYQRYAAPLVHDPNQPSMRAPGPSYYPGAVPGQSYPAQSYFPGPGQTLVRDPNQPYAQHQVPGQVPYAPSVPGPDSVASSDAGGYQNVDRGGSDQKDVIRRKRPEEEPVYSYPRRHADAMMTSSLPAHVERQKMPNIRSDSLLELENAIRSNEEAAAERAKLDAAAAAGKSKSKLRTEPKKAESVSQDAEEERASLMSQPESESSIKDDTKSEASEHVAEEKDASSSDDQADDNVKLLQ